MAQNESHNPGTGWSGMNVSFSFVYGYCNDYSIVDCLNRAIPLLIWEERGRGDGLLTTSSRS